MTRHTNLSPELPRAFGSVDYWLRRAAGAPVAIDALFDKRQKEIHRYTIADVNGPLTLTIPIVKPHGKPMATWRDVRISDHGQWWHVHRVSLESAYGRTPFFEFYIDRFLPYLSPEAVDRHPSILSYNESLEAVIASLLLLPPVVESNSAATPPTSLPSLPALGSQLSALPPYWQPRQSRFGFLPGLSVLDLLFCLGPEAALWLRNALNEKQETSQSFNHQPPDGEK